MGNDDCLRGDEVPCYGDDDRLCGDKRQIESENLVLSKKKLVEC